jgi:hypothetical protein
MVKRETIETRHAADDMFLIRLLKPALGMYTEISSDQMNGT